jgi:DNA polymerase I-like protein with 3'-5' exonuclease and polymerase domains
MRSRFGWSKLAETIENHQQNGGIDPHQKTAASMLGLTVEQFLALPKDEQKKARQAAKAINFGYPGGLGVDKFVQYAKTSYGVDFKKTDAKEAKKKWLDTYPELRLHLEDRTQEAMEWQAGKPLPQLTWLQRKRLNDYLRQGEAGRKQANFSDNEVEYFWELLETVAYSKNDDKAIEDCERRKVTNAIRSLVQYRACTLTGRVRNNVKYTDGCNTPFQGVAADGAKLAMWNLLRRGVKVLAFIHDAFDCAVDPRLEKQQCQQIEKIMCESMKSVLGQGIPVATEGELSTCWSKA